MATSKRSSIFECSQCSKLLDSSSKILPCLHSLCQTCIDKCFLGQNGRSECPKCKDSVLFENLQPHKLLERFLRRSHLTKYSDEWKCDPCLEEEGDEVSADNYCHQCNKFICRNCTKSHQKFLKEHKLIELSRHNKEELIKSLMRNECLEHKKEKELYCEKCNMCYCDTCYKVHLNDSNCVGCPSRPLSVREEAKKQKMHYANLKEEIKEMKRKLKQSNQEYRLYIDELNEGLSVKCCKIWDEMEEMIKIVQEKMRQLCEEMREMNEEEIKEKNEWIEKNENLIEKLKIFEENLCFFEKEELSTDDSDILSVLKTISLTTLSTEMTKKCQEKKWTKYHLDINISQNWLEILKNAQNLKRIGFVSFLPNEEINLELEKKVNLFSSELKRISSFCVNKENHFFIADYFQKSIFEFSDSGKFITKCFLDDFCPLEILEISSNLFVVLALNCFDHSETKIFYLERRENPFSYRLINFFLFNRNKFVITKSFLLRNENVFYSFSKKKNIFCLIDQKLNMFCFNEKWEEIRKIKSENLESNEYFYPILKSDFKFNKIWNLKDQYSFCEIIRNIDLENEEKIHFIKNENNEIFKDFCLQNGILYFCNKKGIFSLKQKIFEFENENQDGLTKMFILNNKIFVSFFNSSMKKILIFEIK